MTFVRPRASRLVAFAFMLAAGLSTSTVQAQDKPNIPVIWGDDVGWFNISAYNMGMGYRTPNIDRISKEGALFTDWYGHKAVPPGAPPSSPASHPSARAGHAAAADLPLYRSLPQHKERP